MTQNQNEKLHKIRVIDSAHHLSMNYDNDYTYVVNHTTGKIILSFSPNNTIHLDGKMIGRIHWHANTIDAISDTPPIIVTIEQRHVESHIDLEVMYARAFLAANCK